MKKRYDVMRLAATMDIASGIDIETIYCFLMKVYGELQINPKRLEWTVGEGIIFPVGMRDRFCLESIKPLSGGYTAKAYALEGAILARQEEIE